MRGERVLDNEDALGPAVSRPITLLEEPFRSHAARQSPEGLADALGGEGGGTFSMMRMTGRGPWRGEVAPACDIGSAGAGGGPGDRGGKAAAPPAPGRAKPPNPRPKENRTT